MEAKLVKDILKHKELYYNGTPEIPDAVYDKLEEDLKKINPNHPVLSLVGAPSSSYNKKVKHQKPLLSLDKTYNINELHKFVCPCDTVLSDKLDGMTIKLEYEDGNLVRASTRGDKGQIGEDVTVGALLIDNIPKKISNDIDVVRGELFMKYSVFENFKDEFDCIRNAIAGAIRRKHKEKSAHVLKCLSYYAYEIIDSKEKSYIDELKKLSDSGFSIPNYKLLNKNISINDLKKYTTSLEKQTDIPRDGLVFHYNDNKLWQKLGNTSHHPRGSIAYKIKGDTAESKILDIILSTGRTGKITYRAKLEPFELSGAKIQYATLHNADFIVNGGYSPGCIVEIIRSGEVIPYITKCVKKSGKKYVIPDKCPACSYKLRKDSMNLYCDNTSCKSIGKEGLVYYASIMKMKGISDKLIAKLMTANLLATPVDFYKLKKDDLLLLDGIKDKSATNIINSINKTKNVTSVQLIASIGIKGVGLSRCKDLMNEFGTIEKIRKLKKMDIIQVNGWSDIMADKLVTGLRDNSDLIDDLLDILVLSDKDGVDDSLNGLTFCVTGKLSKPRNDIKLFIEEKGGKMVGSISSKLSYLVMNGDDTSSTKYKKANSLKIKIITEEELYKLG